jgi:hypothetical protein
VLDASASELPQESGAWRPNRPALPPVVFAAPAAVATALARERVLILDFAPSPQYRRSHIAGSWFVSAPRLRESASRLPIADRVVVTSPDGVRRLRRATGRRARGRSVNVLSGGARRRGTRPAPLRRGWSTCPAGDRRLQTTVRGTDNATARCRLSGWGAASSAQLERDGPTDLRALTAPAPVS